MVSSYDEAARDGSPLDAEILEVERKLAARRAEQYQSPYTSSSRMSARFFFR